MVTGIGVQAQAAFIMAPGASWACVLAPLATAVRDALMDTLIRMNSQGRML
jgi:hypothetical protein